MIKQKLFFQQKNAKIHLFDVALSKDGHLVAENCQLKTMLLLVDQIVRSKPTRKNKSLPVMEIKKMEINLAVHGYG